jgi:imidazolonepropionase-like amidohydrolase
MRASLALALLAAAVAAQAPTDAAPAPQAPAPKVLVIRARSVCVSPSTVRADAALVIENGMLTAIDTTGKKDWPADAEVLDFPDATVTAGLVLAMWRPPGAGDDPVDAITPGAIGADVLDPFEPQPRLSRGGVTAACVTSGADRLVTGQGSAVRIGADPDHYLLRRSACVRVNVGEGPRRTPDLFKPPVLPGPDDPLPRAVPQGPKTRAGAIAELRALLSRASAIKANTAWRPREGEVDLRPFVRVLNGELPLRVAADREADVARAIELAREFKVRLVIEGGNEAWRLAGELKAIDAAVILRVASVPAIGTSPSAPVFRAAGEGSPAAAAALKAAGVTVALVPPTDAEAHNLAYHAGRALGPEFAWTDVLAAITLNAARVTGIDADVGTITTGRRADLVVWPSDPFEASTHPLLVIAGGRVTHRVKIRDDLVALTVKRVHTCAGDAIDRATVLVEKGKIRAVGQRVTIPADARRITDPEAVIVPGFVDAGGQVGIRGYQVTGEDAVELLPPVGPLGMDQSLAKLFDPDLPAVAAAASAGVTTVALTPGGGRLPSGVIAVVKTAGPPKERVAKAVGGVLFDASASPPSEATRKQLDSMLEAGKKYADSFTEHEKALAEWKKGVKTAQKPREKIEAAKGQKPRDAITGTWTGNVTLAQIPRPLPITIKMKLDGTTVTGSFSMSMGGRRQPREIEFTGTFSDGKLQISAEAEGRRFEVNATVGRDVLNGTISMGQMGEAQIEATRTEGGSAAAGSDSRPAEEKKDDAKKDEADDGRPKPPKAQPAMEPYRELFADRASAFVACPSEALAEIVLDVFRTKYELRTVIITTQEIQTLAPKLAAAGVALAPTAASIREEEGVLINPAAIATQQKIPVLFRTGWDGDPRGLYLVAEGAVRHGVDPEDALRMITRQPARFLGLLDRLGSIERGKDADLLILSGEPFAPGTRVERVMVNGRFLDEAKENP